MESNQLWLFWSHRHTLAMPQRQFNSIYPSIESPFSHWIVHGLVWSIAGWIFQTTFSPYRLPQKPQTTKAISHTQKRNPKSEAGERSSKIDSARARIELENSLECRLWGSVVVCRCDEYWRRWAHKKMIGFRWILFQFELIHSSWNSTIVCAARRARGCCGFSTFCSFSSSYCFHFFFGFSDFRQNVSIIFSTPVPFWFFLLLPHPLVSVSVWTENRISVNIFSLSFFLSFFLSILKRQEMNLKTIPNNRH